MPSSWLRFYCACASAVGSRITSCYPCWGQRRQMRGPASPRRPLAPQGHLTTDQPSRATFHKTMRIVAVMTVSPCSGRGRPITAPGPGSPRTWPPQTTPGLAMPADPRGARCTVDVATTTDSLFPSPRPTCPPRGNFPTQNCFFAHDGITLARPNPPLAAPENRPREYW